MTILGNIRQHGEEKYIKENNIVSFAHSAVYARIAWNCPRDWTSLYTSPPGNFFSLMDPGASRSRLKSLRGRCPPSPACSPTLVLVARSRRRCARKSQRGDSPESGRVRHSFPSFSKRAHGRRAPTLHAPRARMRSVNKIPAPPARRRRRGTWNALSR